MSKLFLSLLALLCVSLRVSHGFGVGTLSKPFRGSSRITTVESLDEYRDQVSCGQSEVVVVRFFSNYCKACERTSLPYQKLSQTHPTLKFIDVPNTPSTAAIFEAFGITRLPYAHIYHPEVGLSEETKCNKRLWKDFSRKVKSWSDMECEVVYDDDEDPPETSYVLSRAGLTGVDGVSGVWLV
ncbi:hypothetical protein TrVE_jg1826 [Triparma verrucosa]|uniref:Thioredoxin domain-containing protein n=1 Tax=Triparma verrucosa TaxID=1606542 RepID=A0A9W7C117_9STRA|nr:hypothetical protein TrVE_jg1826 [Triparma verrucosa]